MNEGNQLSWPWTLLARAGQLIGYLYKKEKKY